MRAGVSTYTFPLATARAAEAPIPWVQRLVNLAANYRLHAVQIGDNLPLDTLTTGQLERLAHYAADQRIMLQTGMRGLTIKKTLRQLEIAVILGSPFLRVVIDEPGYHPSVDAIRMLLESLLPDFEKAGVTLAIENHDRFSAATLRGLIDHAASPRIGICLDTANSLGAGEGIREVARELASWVVNLHVKDIRIPRVGSGMGFRVDGVAAGDGLIPIPELINLLDGYGRCDTATLELWSAESDDPEQDLKMEQGAAEKSIRYLKKYTV